MAQFGSIITNIGLAKISNAQITNSTIGIESMVLGDGNGAYYTVSQSQTALRNEVWRGLLADQRIDVNNPNRIEFSAFIPSTVGGFTIREVGLLDTDGNLIALSLYPEQYKPTLGEGISDDILIHFVIETSNASVITLAVDVTNVIATRQYVDRKTAEVNDVLTEHLAQNNPNAHKASNISVVNPETQAMQDMQTFAETLFTSVSNGKTLVGTAITDVDDSLVVPTNPTFQELAELIGSISTGKKFLEGTSSSVVSSSTYYLKLRDLDFTPSIAIASLASANYEQWGDLIVAMLPLGKLVYYGQPTNAALRGSNVQGLGGLGYQTSAYDEVAIVPNGVNLKVTFPATYNWIIIE